MTDAERLLSVARGDAPGDLVLRNAKIVNVFSGAIESEDVVIAGAHIAGVGGGYEATVEVDLGGRYLLPGLIDAHVHIESSMATPKEFARAVVPRGTLTVVSDPHEIANVHGLEGIRYMLQASERLPLGVFVMASSCVPATHMATAGASLDSADLVGLLDHPRVIGLAEVMNFPGAIDGSPDVLEKLRAFAGRVVDGHAPGVRGQALNAYHAAGPLSDHECTTAEEAAEKLSRGMFVFFREATNARNLDALLPVLDGMNERRVALCTDDRQPPDLLDEGGIDSMVRRVIAAGHDPVAAIRLATLNPAEYFGLRDRGAIAPGRRADLIVATELESVDIEAVYAGGTRMDDFDWAAIPVPDPPDPSMHVDIGGIALDVADQGRHIRVIQAIPNQIVTGAVTVAPRVEGAKVAADPGRDVLKICVVERHRGTGNVGLGFVRGIGLERGALAGTVAHDHHNVIAVGVDDASLLTAISEVVRIDGGLAVADGENVLASLALPVAGLMSPAPIEQIREDFDHVVAAARSLGTPLHDPFMAMSFLGLEVIPSLKLTDRGLVDVEAFEIVDLWTDEAPASG